MISTGQECLRKIKNVEVQEKFRQFYLKENRREFDILKKRQGKSEFYQVATEMFQVKVISAMCFVVV